MSRNDEDKVDFKLITEVINERKTLVVLICVNCPSVAVIDTIQEHLTSSRVKFLFLKPDEATVLYLVLVALQDLRQVHSESFNDLVIYDIDSCYLDSVHLLKLLSQVALLGGCLAGSNKCKAEMTLNKLNIRKMSNLY
ncbi:BA75_03339T0 [Komagataella pastoris]|uniref:BA75_03339T0 n=1 Tax=Komagataella pastoris TaxID=4922 RepID=A0A1B2JHA6_PICPA|nr:BA75_03339T0 [Komagataella pastoris]